MSTILNGLRHPDGDPGEWAGLRVEYTPADRAADLAAGRAAAAGWLPPDPRWPVPPPTMRVIVHEAKFEWQGLAREFVLVLTRLEQRRAGLAERARGAQDGAQAGRTGSPATNGTPRTDEFAPYDAARARWHADRAAAESRRVLTELHEASARTEAAVRAAPQQLEAVRNQVAEKLWTRLSVFEAGLLSAHRHADHLRQPLDELLAATYLNALPGLEAAAHRLLELPRQRALPSRPEE